MSEKVLGFKEKDAERISKGRGIFYLATRLETNEGYAIEKEKLVPVVSVEWLKKDLRKRIAVKYRSKKHLLDSIEEAIEKQAVEKK